MKINEFRFSEPLVNPLEDQVDTNYWTEEWTLRVVACCTGGRSS